MGSINLKHTGSGSDIALSSDGTSLLLNGTAVGGGGGGALDFVSKTTVSSAVSYVDFTNLDDNAYYKLVGQGIKFSSSFNLPKIDFMNASN